MEVIATRQDEEDQKEHLRRGGLRRCASFLLELALHTHFVFKSPHYLPKLLVKRKVCRYCCPFGSVDICVYKYIVVVYCVCAYECVARVGLYVCLRVCVCSSTSPLSVVLAFAACSCVWFVPAAAKSAMSSAVNRVCNVENVDSETTRFEWVVGSLSKYQLGDKVTSTNVAAGELFCHRLCVLILLVHVKKFQSVLGVVESFCVREGGREGRREGGGRE